MPNRDLAEVWRSPEAGTKSDTDLADESTSLKTIDRPDDDLLHQCQSTDEDVGIIGYNQLGYDTADACTSLEAVRRLGLPESVARDLLSWTTGLHERRRRVRQQIAEEGELF